MPTALVTGATGGIGSQAARFLAERHWKVIALVRNEHALGQLDPRHCADVRAADIRSDSDLERALGGIHADVLVHAAGALGPAGPVWQIPCEDAKEVVETNVLGTLNLLRVTVPNMIKMRRGHIVLMGSILGQYPSAGTVAYGATKAAVHSLALDLRCELVGSGVRVTELVLGRVRTGMHSQLTRGSRSCSLPVYEEFECLEPSDVAEAIVFALSAPERANVTRLELLPRSQAPGGSFFGVVKPVPESQDDQRRVGHQSQ